MLLEQIEKNRKSAFEHFVEIKKQDKNTIIVNGNEYSFRTKRGLLKKYIGFNSFKEMKKSSLFNYESHIERVNGFYFIQIT